MERGVIWSADYHDKLILAVDPLLNTMTIKCGVMLIYTYNEFKDVRWKNDFSELGGIMIISHVWIWILVTFVQVVLQKVVHIFTN